MQTLSCPFFSYVLLTAFLKFLSCFNLLFCKFNETVNDATVQTIAIYFALRKSANLLGRLISKFQTP